MKGDFPQRSRFSFNGNPEVQLLSQAIGNTQGLLAGTTPPRAGVLVITCSDLRGDPFTLIDKRFPVFVLQNFGNLVEPAEPGAASPVEVSLALFPVSDILVVGHTPCSFLDKTVLGRSPKTSGCSHLRDASLTDLRHLAHRRWKQGLRLSNQECAEVNVCLQLDQLIRSPSVNCQVHAEDIALHGAVVEGEKIRWLRATAALHGPSLIFVDR